MNDKVGFISTSTQLADTACEDLNRKIAQEKRAKWREEAHRKYAKSDPNLCGRA